MKITLACIGKTKEAYLKEGILSYTDRLKRFVKFEIMYIPDIKNQKNMPPSVVKEKEADAIKKHFSGDARLILLDEKGRSFRSKAFAAFIQKQISHSNKDIVFLIGGAYGFTPDIYQTAYTSISLSPMTFSHQLVRILLLEQMYRAFSIIHNTPYHNE